MVIKMGLVNEGDYSQNILYAYMKYPYGTKYHGQ